MMRGKHRFIAVLILVLVIAGHFAYWRISAERLRTGYQAWAAGLVGKGWDVASGPLTIGGWPRAVHLVRLRVRR